MGPAPPAQTPETECDRFPSSDGQVPVARQTTSSPPCPPAACCGLRALRIVAGVAVGGWGSACA